jgi:hypothetical protein
MVIFSAGGVKNEDNKRCESTMYGCIELRFKIKVFEDQNLIKISGYRHIKLLHYPLQISLDFQAPQREQSLELFSSIKKEKRDPK